MASYVNYNEFITSWQNMTESESTDARRSPRSKRFARRVLEIITAAAFLLAIFYWPTTNTGRLILIAAGVVWLVGLRFLSKWPSI
jgi:hypothetical protein